MIRKFTHAFHLPGTVSADVNIRFKAPTDCALVHVSAVGSNTNHSQISIGTSADVDGFLTKSDIGDGNTPAEFDLDDFDGALLTNAGSEYPDIDDGDIIVVGVDLDSGSGGTTAVDDLTIVLTFVEG